MARFAELEVLVDSVNDLLGRIEEAGLWAYFHKDWLLQIRSLLRPQLPAEYHLFVESEAILITPTDFQTPRPLLPDVAISRADTDSSVVQPVWSMKGTAAVVEFEQLYEIDTNYSLLIRRAPENYLVAALEILSPSNKGLGNRLDEEKHLRKRDSFFAAGIQVMEIDALIQGRRELPERLMDKLHEFARVAWTVACFDGRRRFRGWGWNETDPLPKIPWLIDRNVEVFVDLAESVGQAFDFNHWAELVTSAERKLPGRRE
jgi:hypothetical protein